MPLTKKGRTIKRAMTSTYGEEEGTRVFYASANKGRIKGVHKAKDGLTAIADADGSVWTRGAALGDDMAMLDAVVRHRDGYLTCEARVARTGLQRYRGSEVGLPQQDHVVLYRPPEEVFSRDAMWSMANKPVTLTHPKKMVDATSWSKVAKGFSGNEVVRDGEYVRVPLMLTDASTIDSFECGDACELSVGYTTDIDWSPGTTPDGVAYHGVQRQIRGNHHALVPLARGGEHLRFGDAQYESQGASVQTCESCGAEITGDPLSCPMCGYDRHPTFRAGEKIGDYSEDQPRGDDGKWTAAQEEHFQGLLSQIRKQQKLREADGHPPRDPLEIKPEEYDDNDQNWPNADTRYGEDLNRPGKQRSFQRERPTPNVKFPKGSMFTRPEWGGTASDAYPEAALYDRDVSEEERKSLAEKGHALPGGGYPIKNRGDLGNAIQAFGRAKNKAATKALIKRRAKELGAESMLPEDWTADAADGGNREELGAMAIVRTFDGIPISFADEVSAAAMDREMRKLTDQVANFKGKQAKPFGKNGKNGNGKNGDDDNDTTDQDTDTGDAGQGGAAAIEAQRRRVTAEDGLKKQVEAKDGEIAVLKKQIADAATTDAKIETMAAERIATLDAAKSLLPKDFKDSGKSLADIRRAAVATQFTDAEMKDWTDDQVIGAFRTMAKTGAKASSGGAAAMADSMSHGMRVTDSRVPGQTMSLADAEKVAADEHAAYVKRLTDGYKNPISVVRN